MGFTVRPFLPERLYASHIRLMANYPLPPVVHLRSVQAFYRLAAGAPVCLDIDKPISLF